MKNEPAINLDNIERNILFRVERTNKGGYEPDLPFFWNDDGTGKLLDVYTKVARKIKSIDPTEKVGGPSVANGYNEQC
ncbi:hypothetical protein PT277_01770 [Acetobacteraceae bacterium ESL0709]|nr:hypothetical protein [Acetobacteraceae bacterium ESL0697]MDF7677430.1 hypothetical protein [Acetobacteraceae bacterium ESL0709]